MCKRQCLGSAKRCIFLILCLLSLCLEASRIGGVISHRTVRSTIFLLYPTSTDRVMASKPTGNRQLDKIMKFLHLRPKAPQPTESSIDITATQPPTNPLPPPQLAGNIEPSSTKPEKVFTKGKAFKRDMAILSIAYTLKESSELKRLIQLIVVIRDNDSEGQVMSAMYHVYRSTTVSSFSLPKFTKPALGSVFNLHLLTMPSAQKPHGR